MKKNLLLLVFFSTSFLFANSQTPDWIWARSASGSHDDHCNAIATDENGNMIMTGDFLSDSITFETTTLTKSFNQKAVFIVKYDNNGNLIWAHSIGVGDYDAIGTCIACDHSGNVFVAGRFGSSTLTIGTTTLTNTNPGPGDVFVVKYDTAGNVVWAKSGAGTYDDRANGIAVDANGYVYVTGYYSGTSIVFGSHTLTGTTGVANVFTVKYDNNGTAIWAKSAQQGVGNAIAIDNNGNVFVTGQFSRSTLYFGTTSLTNASTGSRDIFLGKYDNAGNEIWAKRAGGTYDDEPNSIAADTSGNIFITGYYNSDSMIVGLTNLVSAGNGDIFIAKYDNSGGNYWAKSLGGMYADNAYDITVDIGGNIYLVGAISDTLTFGSSTISHAGVFVGKYDNAGNELWAKTANSNNYVTTGSVTVDGNYNILLAGSFSPSGIAFGSDSLSSTGLIDVFVAKLGNVTGIEGPVIITDGTIIYPNPASHSLHVNTDLEVNTQYQIFTLLGALLSEKKTTGNEFDVDISSLGAGLYFIKFKNENAEVVRRFVKE